MSKQLTMSMEDYLRLEKNSRNQQALGIVENTVAAHPRQSVYLRGMLKPGKPNLSYADLHHEVPKNVEDVSYKSAGNHLKQHRGEIVEEELVKYMSKLPSYLERGQTCQEKVLNVGVLDWGRLENWQCSQKQMAYRYSRHSLSSSNSSSPFSSEGSSIYSSRGQSFSSGQQRIRRPSLQFHLMSSPPKGHSHSHVKSFEEGIGKLQDVKGSPKSSLIEQGKLIRVDQPFSKNHPEISLNQCKGKDTHPKENLETGTSANGVNYEVLQCTKTKMKMEANTITNVQEGELFKKVGKLPEQRKYVADQYASQKSEAAVVIPRYLPQGNYSGVPHKSTMMAGKRAEELGRRSFADFPEENFLPAVSSDVPHSCPLPYENDQHSVRNWRSIDAENMSMSCLPDSSQSVPHQANIGMNLSCGIVSQKKKSAVMVKDSSSKEPSMGSDAKSSKSAIEKVRSTSPFRRISIGMGKISKSFSSKEGSSKPQSSSTYNSAKSGSENAMAFLCQENSSSNTQSATSRSRSSPLRRLLEPMLKPKPANIYHSEEPLRRGSASAHRVCKSSNVQLNLITSGTTGVSDPSNDKTHRLAAFQALLRVAIKNGQPLFTFAVDNECDILVATMKKLSDSREDDYSCVYTFFTFQDVKRKNGRWINQGGKGKGHDYLSNVVAQLKVSGSQFSNMTRQNYVEQSFAREFILFAVDLQQAEQRTSDFQSNDELAAIVLKIPRIIDRGTSTDRNQTGKCSNFLEAKCNATSGNVQNQPFLSSQGLINATAILPSGVHTLPSKGGPSSLIQRWRSGGSCDCGGWDLGCELRILVDQNQLNKKSSSNEACLAADRFELISQVGEEENQPVFSIAPFKDGIYSVEFSASLSTLQAFSLCIAVLDGKTLCETSESSNMLEEKTSLETILLQNNGTRSPNGIDGDVPARYASYPPLSPAGRV